MVRSDIEGVIEVLYELRGVLHGKADTCAVEKVDEAIKMLEELQSTVETNDRTGSEALRALDIFIRQLPSILRLIGYLSD